LNPDFGKEKTLKPEKQVRFTDDTKDDKEDAPKPESVRDRLKATSTCHRCGKKGHWKKDCPHREQKANLAEVDEDESAEFAGFAIVEKTLAVTVLEKSTAEDSPEVDLDPSCGTFWS